MVIKIYKIDPSPPARAVFMTVEILGLKIETEEVNTLLLEQYKPEFLKKNPIHTIPLLEEGDFILADSHAIITYLVSKYGAEKRAILYPADLRTRATVDQRLFFDATLAFPKVRDIVIGIVKEKNLAPTEKQVADVNEVYGFLEKYLERSPYLVGDGITLADISCVSTISSLNVFVPIEDKYEKLKEWLANLEEKEWYKKANEPGLKIFTEAMKNVMAKNASGQ